LIISWHQRRVTPSVSIKDRPNSLYQYEQETDTLEYVPVDSTP
jgi:hypothetical protein